MATYKQITQPSDNTLTLGEAKAHLNIASYETYDDDMITGLLLVARTKIERAMWRPIGSQTFKLYLDYVDLFGVVYVTSRSASTTQNNIINITKTPLISVQSIQYYDSNNTLQTLSSSKYEVDTVSDIARIKINDMPTMYDKLNTCIVSFTAGFTTSSNPDEIAIIKHAMKMVIGDLYTFRENVTMAQFYEIPNVVLSLLNPLKNSWYYPNIN